MAPVWKRLVQPIPDPKGRPVIWIHGVSVGEIKSAQPLYRALRLEHPDAFFLITTTTTTGQAEARRSHPDADAICYLPIDFPWLVMRWVKRLQPQLFLLLESDFWPFLLRAVQKQGGKNVLVSGKMSAKSSRRFLCFSYLSRKLFSYFDLLCVQNQEHYDRFRPLVSDLARLQITGNLKLDICQQTVDTAVWRKIIDPNPCSIAISCTHAGEELSLLQALYSIPELFFFLAPRHPERFEEVAQLLHSHQIPFRRFSQLETQARGKERILLMDTMGQLPICYTLSCLAIIGGSFVPIGGHNILEPCLYGVPVLFGPHMDTQTELVSKVLRARAGLQVELLQVRDVVASIIQNKTTTSLYRGVAELVRQCGGVVEKTMGELKKVWG